MDKKEQKKAYMKAYYLKNKEKIVEKQKEYKERIKEYQKEYMKEYYQKHKDKMKEWNKTPAGKKSSTIKNWKIRGLVCEDYDSLYDRYIESKNCEECGCEYGKFGDGSWSFRCMDHSHITGLFRNFLCCGCNRKRR